MPTPTDPARELADLCARMRDLRAQRPGADFLAEHFGVPVWSAEFYEIVFTIAKRVSSLKVLVSGLSDVDNDIREQACGHLDTILLAFSQAGLNNHWSHASSNYISAEHVNPIRMLSSEVRRVQPLTQLTGEELGALIASVNELLDWLREHQLKEQDFIRQAIIEGLETFRFRVERISWVGWGYALDSLRDVIGAYLALERGIDATQQPDGQAVLLKTGTALKAVFRIVGVVKDFSDRANWLLEGYKNISAAVVAHSGVVALIGASSSA